MSLGFDELAYFGDERLQEFLISDLQRFMRSLVSRWFIGPHAQFVEALFEVPVVIRPENEAELMMSVEDLVTIIPEQRNRDVIVSRYGLLDGRAQSAAVIAQRFGVNHQRVTQLEMGVLRKMREHPHTHELRYFIVETPKVERTGGDVTISFVPNNLIPSKKIARATIHRMTVQDLDLSTQLSEKLSRRGAPSVERLLSLKPRVLATSYSLRSEEVAEIQMSILRAARKR